MQQQVMQMQQKMQQMELDIKGQDSKTKFQKVQQDGAIDAEELKQDYEIETAKINQKERDSKRDHRLGMLELAIKGTTEGGPR